MVCDFLTLLHCRSAILSLDLAHCAVLGDTLQLSSRWVLATVTALWMSMSSLPPAWAQSFDNLLRQVPGLVFDEFVRDAPQTRPGPGARRAPIMVDAIPVAQCREIQSALAVLGFDVGTVDGQCGPRSLRAIRAFQESLGAPATGTLTERQ